MEQMTSIEKQFPWSFLGFLLGTISLVIALGFFYLSKQEAITDLQFIVEDEFLLVEIKESFPNITILLNGNDILGDEKVIKILRIRMQNNGRSILQSYYDQHIPFGLVFEKSSILALASISEPKTYLSNNLFRDGEKQQLSAGKLMFNKPIIEKGKAVSFKVYLLQEKKSGNTIIRGLGKISGLKSIKITYPDRELQKKGKLSLSKSAIVALSLAFAYGGILLVLITGIALNILWEKIKQKKRKTLCAYYIKTHNGLTDDQIEIINSYEEGWRSYYLPTIRTLAGGGEALEISDLVEEMLPQRSKGLIAFWSVEYRSLMNMLPFRWESIVFDVNEGKISFNKDNEKVLLDFLEKADEL